MNELAPIILAFQLTFGGPAPREALPPQHPVAHPPTAQATYVATAWQRRRQTNPDRWFAEDKLRHFFMSYATTQIAYGAARLAGAERDPALIGAAGASAAAGVWKEWRDRRLGGPFSGRDLVWDALGTGAGVAVASRIR